MEAFKTDLQEDLHAIKEQLDELKLGLDEVKLQTNDILSKQDRAEDKAQERFEQKQQDE